MKRCKSIIASLALIVVISGALVSFAPTANAQFLPWDFGGILRQRVLDAYSGDNPAEIGRLAGLSNAACGKYWGGLLSGECIAYGIANFLDFVAVKVIGKMVSFVGGVFAVFATFALNGAMYDSLAIDEGWKIVRDVANISFIFILLYIGIATILDTASHDTTKLLARVIIAAMLINFSLALAKIPIDAGNIFAISFYNAIDAPEMENVNLTLEGSLVPKDISAGIMNALNPQKLFIAASEDSSVELTLNASLIETLTAIIINDIFVIIALGLLLYVFLTGILIFLGRIVVLWILLILSPAAFIAYGANMTSSFNKWREYLINYSIVAPVYMFFIYLTLRLSQSEFTKLAFQQAYYGAAEAGTLNALTSWASSNAMFFAAYLIILGFLTGGTRMAKQLGIAGAQTFDKALNKTVGFAKTAAVGLATGGAGLVAGAAISGTQYAGRRIVKDPIDRKLQGVYKDTEERIKKEREDAEKSGKEYRPGYLRSAGRNIVMRGSKMVTSGTEALIGEREKKFKDMKSADEIKLAISGPLTSFEDQMAGLRVIAEKFKDFKPFASFDLKNFEHTYERFREMGVSTKQIDKANAQFSGLGKTGAEKLSTIRETAKKNADATYIKERSDDSFGPNKEANAEGVAEISGILRSNKGDAIRILSDIGDTAADGIRKAVQQAQEEWNAKEENRDKKLDGSLLDSLKTLMETSEKDGGWGQANMFKQILSNPNMRGMREILEPGYDDTKDKNRTRNQDDDDQSIT